MSKARGCACERPPTPPFSLGCAACAREQNRSAQPDFAHIIYLTCCSTSLPANQKTAANGAYRHDRSQPPDHQELSSPAAASRTPPVQFWIVRHAADSMAYQCASPAPRPAAGFAGGERRRAAHTLLAQRRRQQWRSSGACYCALPPTPALLSTLADALPLPERAHGAGPNPCSGSSTSSSNTMSSSSTPVWRLRRRRPVCVAGAASGSAALPGDGGDNSSSGSGSGDSSSSKGGAQQHASPQQQQQASARSW